MKQIKFNTGRLYTEKGQRIVATLHDDGVVTFLDHDRSVDGEFKLCGDAFTQSNVMHAYDHNISKNTRRSYQDAFYEDSVNGKWE